MTWRLNIGTKNYPVDIASYLNQTLIGDFLVILWVGIVFRFAQIVLLKTQCWSKFWWIPFKTAHFKKAVVTLLLNSLLLMTVRFCHGMHRNGLPVHLFIKFYSFYLSYLCRFVICNNNSDKQIFKDFFMRCCFCTWSSISRQLFKKWSYDNKPNDILFH